MQQWLSMAEALVYSWPSSAGASFIDQAPLSEPSADGNHCLTWPTYRPQQHDPIKHPPACWCVYKIFPLRRIVLLLCIRMQTIVNFSDLRKENYKTLQTKWESIYELHKFFLYVVFQVSSFKKKLGCKLHFLWYGKCKVVSRLFLNMLIMYWV